MYSCKGNIAFNRTCLQKCYHVELSCATTHRVRYGAGSNRTSCLRATPDWHVTSQRHVPAAGCRHRSSLARCCSSRKSARTVKNEATLLTEQDSTEVQDLTKQQVAKKHRRTNGANRKSASKSYDAHAPVQAEAMAISSEDHHGAAMECEHAHETTVASIGTNGTTAIASAVASLSNTTTSPQLNVLTGPVVMVTKPLPKVLILHTGGTLGMDVTTSFEEKDDFNVRLKPGGPTYGGLKPGDMLANLLTVVPELNKFSNVDLLVVFNKDSSRVGPDDWVRIAKILDDNRPLYDAFMIVHGTDTMAYTASALSLMLRGFRKPIVLTGSQLPLAAPRTDARQNMLDSIQCATASFSPPHVNLQEVAICFGGKLLRGNRAQKVHSSSYQAFDSPSYPPLATLGIDVEWNERYLHKVEGAYKPRFKREGAVRLQLDPRVIRVPVVPGSDPRLAYGDLYGRGVRGVVLEAFGVGNLPDLPDFGWIPWLQEQTKQGLQVYLASQCSTGPLNPGLYSAGQLAVEMGVEAGPHMTPECSVVKMMFCLAYPDLGLGIPFAGEL